MIKYEKIKKREEEKYLMREEQLISLIVFQVISLIFQFFIANIKNRTYVMILTFLLNISNLLCYLLNDDMTAFYSAIIICIRTFVYIFMEKIKEHKWHWIIPSIAIIIQFFIGMKTIGNIFELIPILVPCYTCYYLWFYANLQKLRVGNMIGNTLWFVYNVVTGLYILSLSRIITVAINGESYIKNRNRNRKEEREEDGK